jgi:hypothetical protein
MNKYKMHGENEKLGKTSCNIRGPTQWGVGLKGRVFPSWYAVLPSRANFLFVYKLKLFASLTESKGRAPVVTFKKRE